MLNFQIIYKIVEIRKKMNIKTRYKKKIMKNIFFFTQITKKKNIFFFKLLKSYFF